MIDVTVRRVEDLEGYQGQFLYAGKALGVTAWGMNVLRLPPDWEGYPEHDHAKDGQEEVYLTLEGSARLEAGGQSWLLLPGHMARVGSTQKRKVVPGHEGVVMLVMGGTPGKAYQPR
jgi:mannose-6-phosphate isomerase-like protein (cupin superfamily)